MSFQLATLKDVEICLRKALSPQYDVSGTKEIAWGTLDGAQVTQSWLQAKVAEGKVFAANGGRGSGPITFAGAYDADAPDLHINVPLGTTIIPVYLEVIYEAVGTETTMEIIGLASSTGSAAATGTATTAYNMRIGGGGSACRVTAAVDAAGVTDPNGGQYFEFWKFQRPLTDTVASGENDRLPLVFSWSGLTTPAPMIVGSSANGACMAVYAASQAGTGFITAIWVEDSSGNL